MSNFVDFNRGLWKKEKKYPVVKLKRSKGYTYMFRILLVKICLGLKWRRNQDKVRDSLSPRGGGRGEALMEVWVGVCYWGLQTLTLFQTKTIHFATLFKTLLHCKHSPHGQGFWCRKTTCSLPWQPFLSCQAILIPNNGSYVICAPRYSWPYIFDQGVLKLHKIPTRHTTCKTQDQYYYCIPCLWLKTPHSVQLQMPV